MAKARGDTRTRDLLTEWRAPDVAVRFEDERLIRAHSLSHRISRSVSHILKSSDLKREAIAEEMSAFLGAAVSLDMLNAYASESRETHNISVERAEALLHATDDPRLFGDVLERHGYAVIPRRYLAAVDEVYWTDVEEMAGKKKRAAKRRRSGLDR